MKITYVTDYDAKDIHKWSGLGYYIAKSLEDQGCEITYLTLPVLKFSILHKIKMRLYKMFGKTYLISRNLYFSKRYAQLAKDMINESTDIIFCPGTNPIAFFKTEKPIVFYTDATFAGMIGFYEHFNNLTKGTISNGNHLEQSALTNCTLGIYSSDWAAKTATDNYDVDPRKIVVIPFGSNIESSRTVDDIKNIINQKSKTTVKLLFLGVDWIRKGGEVALRTAERLNNMGIKTELHIAGIKSLDFSLPSYVFLHGYVSKATQNGRDLIDSLLKESHFLILPTKADCTPIVYSEANSFGLPCISTNVGGIPTIIKDGVNGKLFTLMQTDEDYADYINTMFSDMSSYEKLCLESFNRYESTLNWSVTGKKIVDLLTEIKNTK